ncbi:FtsK/SpoIIIE domain-containing protein [Lactococcus lactis]|uniref:FtsK/SpoIIIE domain-containing protein n=1 Tax=Lactococcus lactis TaxID=1358 RepID=UPI000CE2D4B0|nr:FtsK/SpoIIIE domain-containing protein [Lactococcus lactis]PPA66547.1 otitis media-associated H10 [Lactococcus lactis]
MNRIINKFLSKIITLFIPLPPQEISLYKTYPDFKRKLSSLTLGYVFIIVLLFFFSFAIHNILILPSWLFLFYLSGKIFRIRREFKNNISRWDNFLMIQEFIINNGLYKEKETSDIFLSAVFTISESEKEIIIVACKMGNFLDSKLENLDMEISALFNLPLEEKIIRPAIVEYKFIIERPERLVLKSSSKESLDDLEIDLGYGVKYNPVTCPHILVAGGTGSGKSVFISFLILELLKRDSTIYIADPKNSDLGSLSYYLGDERVATNPNNIARIVRLAVTEMQERYDIMRENFVYGSNFRDHNFRPVFLIFDEMGSFKASGTDKNSKAVVNEVMDGIKQIILLGRAAGVFVLVAAQQVSSDTLSTDLRDNLGLRIALGANSSEGYRMVFGSATPEPQPIEVKGAGFLYKQGAGKEKAQYWESPFLDTQQFDFISQLKLYLNKE